MLGVRLLQVQTLRGFHLRSLLFIVRLPHMQTYRFSCALTIIYVIDSF